jgi:hypothetical protein
MKHNLIFIKTASNILENKEASRKKERKKERGQAWSLPSFYKSRYANCQGGFNELGEK